MDKHETMMTTTNKRKRSLSGIKPTGQPHLGNYMGMIRPAIELQSAYEAFYFVADYHALTTMRDPAELRESSHKLTANFLTFGLDPAQGAAFFRQSDVPQVCELTWLLSCVTNMSMLEKAHAYKAALDRGDVSLNHGLFTYPVLMAADILIYDSDVVPVGQDQIQHVEMARDMAQKFNREFRGDYLRLPEAMVRKEVAVVPGIDGRKMSKSYGNVIDPMLPSKQLRKVIMSIVTDTKTMEEAKDPADSTIVALYRLFATPDELAEMEEAYRRGGYGYGHAKQALFEKMDAYFTPYRERYNALMADPDTLEDVLRQGATRVQPVVAEVMERVRAATGLGARR
jgi:tryptophanyl-tRNA synthetase